MDAAQRHDQAAVFEMDGDVDLSREGDLQSIISALRGKLYISALRGELEVRALRGKLYRTSRRVCSCCVLRFLHPSLLAQGIPHGAIHLLAGGLSVPEGMTFTSLAGCDKRHAGAAFGSA